MEFEYSRANPRVTVAFASFEAMHTVLEGVVTDLDEPAARQLFASIETRVREIESRLNRHDPASLFARINASRGREAVPLDEETYVLLQLAELFRRTTDGYFDLAALSDRGAGGVTGSGGVAGSGGMAGFGGVTGVGGATGPEGVAGPGDKTGPGGATGDRRGAASGAAAGGKMADTPGCVLDPATRSVRLTGEGVRLDAGGFGRVCARTHSSAAHRGRGPACPLQLRRQLGDERGNPSAGRLLAGGCCGRRRTVPAGRDLVVDLGSASRWPCAHRRPDERPMGRPSDDGGGRGAFGLFVRGAFDGPVRGARGASGHNRGPRRGVSIYGNRNVETDNGQT